MRAARYYGRLDIRVEDVPIPKPGPKQCLVEIAWCGICGSDLHEYVAGLLHHVPDVYGWPRLTSFRSVGMSTPRTPSRVDRWSYPGDLGARVLWTYQAGTVWVQVQRGTGRDG